MRPRFFFALANTDHIIQSNGYAVPWRISILKKKEIKGGGREIKDFPQACNPAGSFC